MQPQQHETTITIAIQVPEMARNDLKRAMKIGKDLCTGPDDIMDSDGFVVNDFNHMLSDLINEQVFGDSGRLYSNMDSYYDTLMETACAGIVMRNSNDLDKAAGMVDEYLSTATDFINSVMKTGQLDTLKNTLCKETTAHQYELLPKTNVFYTPDGNYVASFYVYDRDIGI